MNIVTDLNEYSQLLKFGNGEPKGEFLAGKFGDPLLSPAFTQVTDVRALFYVISIFKNNSLDFTFSSGFVSSSPAMVLFRSPFHLYSMKRRADIAGYNLMFTPTFIGYAFQNSSFQRDFPYFWNEKNYYYIEEQDELLLSEICEKILFEQSHPTSYTRDVIGSLLRLFLYEFNKIASIPRIEIHDQMAESLLHRFYYIVNTSATVIRSVESVADQLHVTADHLWKNVKKLSGQTPSEIINEKVLMDAKELLLQGQMSISEISFCLQFKEHAHFTRFFKNLTGLSPAAFVRREREEIGK